MAPEVLAGLPYGLAADVWSLGVILFTLLCGRHPFACDDEADEEAAVRGGHLSFADPNWAEVSEAAKVRVSSLAFCGAISGFRAEKRDNNIEMT